MTTEEARDRTRSDFSKKKGKVPTSAFSLNDVCCGGGASFNIRAFFCLEDFAERYEYYESIEEKTLSS